MWFQENASWWDLPINSIDHPEFETISNELLELIDNSLSELRDSSCSSLFNLLGCSGSYPVVDIARFLRASFDPQRGRVDKCLDQFGTEDG